MQPRIGVGVFIFKDGKFLMGQRKGSHGADSWSVPGGNLEFGETPEETAIREVREETGLMIQNVQFAAVTNDIFKDDNKHYITLWMTSDWESGKPIIAEPDKYIEQKWLDLDTLPDLLFLPWQQLLTSEFMDVIKHRLDMSRVAK